VPLGVARGSDPDVANYDRAVLPAFVIGLREGLETVVIIGAITIFLRLRQRGDLLRRVWRASAIAAAICVGIAFVIRLLEVNLAWRQQEQLETVVGVIAVVMVTYMIVWMRRFPKDLQHDASTAAASALASDTGRALVVLAFLAVLREGFEIAVFVIATIGMTGGGAWLATWGAVLGVLVALVVGVGVVRGSTHLNVAGFFRATALVLVVSAAGIAMATVHSGNAAGWITFGQTPQYDLSWLAPPGSVLSSFTTGMFGLQPYPVLIEVLTWIAYLVPMTAIVLWPNRRASQQTTAAAELAASAAADPAATASRSRYRRGAIAGSLGICAALAAAGLALANHQSAPPARTAHTPKPQRILYATLNDVSCAPANLCVAVGEFLPVDADAATGDPDGDGRASHTLVESSDGSHWRVASSPNEGEGGAVLSGVSCPSTRRCVAVGYYRPAKFPLQATSAPPNYPLIETFNGGVWRIAASPHVPPNSILVSVSCPSLTNCVAVGYTTKSTNNGNAEESIFAEALTDNVWRVMAAPSSQETSSALSAVSCSAPSSCVAVGNVAPRVNPSATAPLIESLDDGHWSATPLPLVANGRGILYDVACQAGGRCVAVGSTEANRPSGAALVLSSNGANWQPNPAAMEQSGDISLTAVACASGANCVVAGTSLASLDASPEKILARVSATTWQKLDVVSTTANIDAIACGGQQGCLLVGSATKNSFGNTTAVVAALSGDTWTSESTPAP
jgi:high-affinity iron transporter